MRAACYVFVICRQLSLSVVEALRCRSTEQSIARALEQI